MTTNPWLIMAINMTVVFGVLIALGLLMQLIHMVDPTKKKPVSAEASVAAAPAPVAAPVAANNNDEVVAVIVAAISALGYSSNQIASVKPQVSAGWKLDGRLSGRM